MVIAFQRWYLLYHTRTPGKITSMARASEKHSQQRTQKYTHTEREKRARVWITRQKTNKQRDKKKTVNWQKTVQRRGRPEHNWIQKRNTNKQRQMPAPNRLIAFTAVLIRCDAVRFRSISRYIFRYISFLVGDIASFGFVRFASLHRKQWQSQTVALCACARACDVQRFQLQFFSLLLPRRCKSYQKY